MIEVSGRGFGQATPYKEGPAQSSVSESAFVSIALKHAPLMRIGILKSSVGFDYAKRFGDCHCEGEARSNLRLTKTEIPSSFHSSQ